MLSINPEKLVKSLLKRGMVQAHIGYDFTICKSSEIPPKLKSSIKKNASNFFDGGATMQYIVLKVPKNQTESSDATSKIVQLIKTNFLDGDKNNTFTTSDVQVGFIEKGGKKLKEAEEPSEPTEEPMKKEEPEEDEEPTVDKTMFYVIKFRIEK